MNLIIDLKKTINYLFDLIYIILPVVVVEVLVGVVVTGSRSKKCYNGHTHTRN